METITLKKLNKAVERANETGGGQQGTKRFLDSLGELKETYTVREIIGLTDGQYGGDAFRRFFEE